MSDGKPGKRLITDRDLESVVALDQQITGRSRRGFFEKRLAASKRTPEAFVWLATGVEPNLTGFVSARILDGEFGGKAPVAVLDVLGIAPAARGKGVAHTLMVALEAELRQRGVGEIQTQVDWQEHDLVQFFGAAGFVLAPNLVLERATAAYR